MVAADLESKRLEFFKDVVPSVTKVMVLHDPSMGTGTADAVTGLEIVVAQAKDPLFSL